MLELVAYIACQRSHINHYSETLKHYLLNGWLSGILYWKWATCQTIRVGQRRYNCRYGIEIDYFDNGRIKWLDHWRYDRLHGFEIRYYSNGQLESLTHWRYDRRYGIVIRYNANGHLIPNLINMHKQIANES